MDRSFHFRDITIQFFCDVQCKDRVIAYSCSWMISRGTDSDDKGVHFHLIRVVFLPFEAHMAKLLRYDDYDHVSHRVIMTL